ncbi:filament polymerization regulator ParJ [soil metagenome]
MEHVRWLAEPTLRTPTVIYAFTGWNDAGDAASSALRTMVERWGAQAVAEIDPEPFTDFATVRPHVRINDGQRSIVWPTVGIWSASLPGGDVLLVLGPEPALRWRLFCDQLVGVAERYGSAMTISLGALLADVPHTRPVQIIGTASEPELIERFQLQRSRYEGPTGIVGVLHDELARSGVATASLWAAVPGYAAQVPSAKAALALIERACALLGTPAPSEALSMAAGEYDVRIAALIADDQELVDYVARLESMVDDDESPFFVAGGDDDDTATATADDDAPPLDAGGADELVAEVERFLRDRDG